MSQNKLHDLIASHIRQQGPMGLGDYMALCLGHPQYGYYMTRDPFGAAGDFTTAPEISQMFGEMIAAWIIDTWDQMGRPSPFALVEGGPGRGTLMEDILRVTANVPGFHAAMKLHLIEMSPVLQRAQSEKLKRYEPIWLPSVETLPHDMPIIFIANELLDALPIRQVMWRDGWVEMVVGIDADNSLRPGVKEADASLLSHIPPEILIQRSAEVFEVSPALNHFLGTLFNRLKRQKGVALFLDYGHARSATGNTLQAVRAHRFENPFETPGESDLTAHVDFDNVGRIARAMMLHATKVVPQGLFLKTLGIEMRAEILKRKATPDQAAQIDSALARLTGTGEGEMGDLFKVIALYNMDGHDGGPPLAGF